MTFKTILSACAVAAMGSAASAATIDFDGQTAGVYSEYVEDGFVFDYVRIVEGNCTSTSGQPCGAENINETSTLTKVGGGTFDVVSLWFKLLGSFTQMTLETDKGTRTFVEGVDYPHNNSGNVLDLAMDMYFQDITYMTIHNPAMSGAQSGNANIRFDDVVAVPSAVPLPASALLLLGGLGGLAAMRRRKMA